MASQHAIPFAVRGQALRVYGWIKDSSTGNPMASPGTLSASISRDGATAISPTNSPIIVPGMNGRWYIDLTAQEMDASNVGLVVSASAAGSIAATVDITTCDMSEVSGHWLGQSVVRLEQGIVQIAGYLFNRVEREIATGTINYYNRSGNLVGTMARSITGTHIGKEELA